MTQKSENGGWDVNSWRSGLLRDGATLQDAIKSLNGSGFQIVLVVKDDDTLVGTLTDGDIRRGLLRGLTLGSPIASIVQRDALLVTPEFDRGMVLQLMTANRVHQMPVVDEQRRVVGLHLWDDLLAPQERPNLIVIMAGGMGSRLRPRTETCPKPMLPVAGKPMLEHIVTRCRADGFKRFVFAINYLGHVIEDHFGSGEQFGVEIEYVREEKPLGTAGAISLLPTAPGEPFVVSNGDILTDIRYDEVLEFHCRHQAVATMAVRLYEWQHPFGVVNTDGIDIVGFAEKPVSVSHVNAGIYVLEPAAISALTPGEVCHMPVLFERLQQRGERTIAYPMHEPWLDVGHPNDYDQAHEAIQDS